MDVEAATPNTSVVLAAPLHPGAIPVPGCPGVTVELNHPQILGVGVSDVTGSQTFTDFVGPALANRTVTFQAAEASACRISGPLAHIFLP